MGKEKAGFLTPKAIANRIKAKGLQKLRWYCQMCQKQCRDENGFKCHTMSESHQRQLLLVAENPDKFVDTFSKEFCDTFIELLSRRFGTKRVHANIVYQEYISDRNHTHMNSTQWETLTEFVKWLGREGYVVADQTEKGWFIAYIDRDPVAIQRQLSTQKKEKMDMDDEERSARFIEQQISRASGTQPAAAVASATELLRQSEDEKVVFKMPVPVADGGAAGRSAVAGPLTRLGDASNPLEVDSSRPRVKHKSTDLGEDCSKSTTSASTGQKRKLSALDEIMQMEEKQKEKIGRKDYWLHVGIVVKVVTKKLGEKYYKKKGVVREVLDKYAALVKMLDSGDKIKVDQTHLETVLPAIGKPVLVVNGGYRDMQATLLSIDETNFCCSISLQSGLLTGRVVDGVQYEDICKVHVTDTS